jgi:hypothetical protein
MLSKIIEAEKKLDALLPLSRLEQNPAIELLTAAKSWSEMVWVEAAQLGQMALSDEQVTNGITLAGRPVFICGVHRSGTTLVRDILDGHPDLVVLPSEGTYYTNLESKLRSLPQNEQLFFLGTEWLRRLANPINQPPYWLLGRSSDNASPYVDFARYLMAWWGLTEETAQGPHTAIILAYAACTNNLTAKLWVDKTPVNERFLKRIWQEMHGAKIIHVIREPTATLASRKRMESSISMRKALLDLKVSFGVAVEQLELNNPQFMLLRYEELCEDPQIVTEQLAAYLNIGVGNTLREPTVAGIPSQANSSFNKKAASGCILKPDEHPQQEVLSLYEQQLISAYLGGLAKRLSYPLIKVSWLRKWYLMIKHGLL